MSAPASERKRKSGRRVSAIRVWSDAADSGLELLVVEHASEQQQIALKLSALRTALDHCKQHIEQANQQPNALTLSETSVRLRGVLSELNVIDKTLSNKGISYASEEQVGAITEADLPAAVGDSPPTSPTHSASPRAAKPSHRQVAAMRSYAQDLLVKCVETTHPNHANGVQASPVAESPSEQRGKTSEPSTPLASPGDDDDKPIIGQAVAAALAQSQADPVHPNNQSIAEVAPVQNSMPSMARGKSSMMEKYTISRWGEVIKEPRAPPTAAEIKKQESLVFRDEERELKWIKMIKDWPRYERSKADKLKRRIRKGIPDSLRGNVWPRLTGAIDAMNKAKPGTYRTYLAQECELDDVIGRDIARTFPHHLLFRDEHGSSGGDGEEKQGQSSGRQSLYNVLKAYANFDKQVGYCQGMGFIVGLFLMYVSEEEAFWMLERVMRGEKYNMYALYAIGFPLLHQWFYQLEQLVAKMQPRLFDHLQMHGITPTLYATQWFFTIFANNMPFELVLRIWDIFLNEGPKVAFRFSLSFLNHFAPAVVAEDFEGSITVLKDMHNDPYCQDADQVVADAMKLKLKSAELRAYAHEYDAQQLHNKMQARRTSGKA